VKDSDLEAVMAFIGFWASVTLGVVLVTFIVLLVRWAASVHD
jgi:hypothetical protein